MRFSGAMVKSSGQMTRQPLKLYAAGAVSLITFVVYFSSLQHEFLQWDDILHISENPHIRSLDLAFIRWAFFDFYAGNWHPLTWMSHALDYAVWGLNPLGHHLTNVILHALNTFVVVLLVVKLLEIGNTPPPINAPSVTPPPPAPPLKIRGGRGSYDPIGEGGVIFRGSFTDKGVLIAAATTGLLFGLHPLHVESVAWVSERKDLLCALFFMLSIMAYLRYATLHFPCGIITSQPSAPFLNPTRPPLNVGGGEGGVISRGGKRWYLISLLFFILALLSKPMAVTLPVVLLMLDWYPLGKIQSFKTARTAIVEKFPFMALSIISSILTVLAQQAGGAIKSIEFAPISIRVLVGVKSLIIYLWKMVLPLDLSPFYPYPREASLFSIEYFLAIVLVAGITIASVVIAKRQKLWLSAWGYYVITLLPVLGIVQVGLQSMADRYTYLPSLGPFLVIGIMASWVWARAERLGEKSQVAKVLAVGSVCPCDCFSVICNLQANSRLEKQHSLLELCDRKGARKGPSGVSEPGCGI